MGIQSPAVDRLKNPVKKKPCLKGQPQRGYQVWHSQRVALAGAFGLAVRPVPEFLSQQLMC